MGTIGFDDILVTPMARISTPGGDVLHALKRSDAGFSGFGEAYFSCVDFGAVKAWKRHQRMTMNIVVPMGKVRFVFHLDGTDNFLVHEIGAERYMRLTIPPGIWFGFQGLAKPQSLIMNLASISHDPDEVDRLTLDDINYEWTS